MSRLNGNLGFREPRLHLTAPFGSDWFGRTAESFARVFGTPAFLIAQTVMVVAWIAVNAVWATFRWDPYPFILLNLLFSVQAAYAAPLILLSQTREADREQALARADAEQREAIARATLARQDALAERTAEVERLVRELHRRLVVESGIRR